MSQSEPIKEVQTIAQIASENGIHPNQISQWKSLALAGLPTLLERQMVTRNGERCYQFA